MEDYKSERPLVAAAIGAQEEERRRVAREMHDGPAQALASMVFRIEIIQKLMEFDQAKAVDELNRLKDSLRASLNEVRKIIYDLRPLAIEELGLVGALDAYLRTWEDKNGIAVRLEWERSRTERLPAEVEITIYRLVQESLGNVARHSGSQAASVSVSGVDGNMSICRVVVRDAGKGFDVESTREAAKGRARFGLAGMFERVQLLGGELHIESAVGQGTAVVAEFPIH